jgi:hypothetical protein
MRGHTGFFTSLLSTNNQKAVRLEVGLECLTGEKSYKDTPSPLALKKWSNQKMEYNAALID